MDELRYKRLFSLLKEAHEQAKYGTKMLIDMKLKEGEYIGLSNTDVLNNLYLEAATEISYSDYILNSLIKINNWADSLKAEELESENKGESDIDMFESLAMLLCNFEYEFNSDTQCFVDEEEMEFDFVSTFENYEIVDFINALIKKGEDKQQSCTGEQYEALYTDWVENSNLPVEERTALFLKFCSDNTLTPADAAEYLKYKIGWDTSQTGFFDAEKGFHKRDIELEILTQIEMQIDSQGDEIRFFLTSFFDNTAQETQVYKGYKSQIERCGCINIELDADAESVKLYNPALAYFFTKKSFPVKSSPIEETQVSTYEYLQTYISGYRDGEQYFEKEFNNSPFPLSVEQYAKKLHSKYYEKGGIFIGWESFKTSIPLVLTHKVIKEYGYYSGMINKADELLSNDPTLKEAFDRLNLGQTTPPSNTEKEIENNLQKSNRVIDEQLKDYFVLAFYSGRNVSNTDYYTENLLKYLQQEHNGKQFAALALLIYESKHARSEVKNMSYAKWRKIFFGCIGIKDVGYKPKDLIGTANGMRATFYYLQ